MQIQTGKLIIMFFSSSFHPTNVGNYLKCLGDFFLITESPGRLTFRQLLRARAATTTATTPQQPQPDQSLLTLRDMKMKQAAVGAMHSATPTLGISRGGELPEPPALVTGLYQFPSFYLNPDIVFQNSFDLIRIGLVKQLPDFQSWTKTRLCCQILNWSNWLGLKIKCSVAVSQKCSYHSGLIPWPHNTYHSSVLTQIASYQDQWIKLCQWSVTYTWPIHEISVVSVHPLKTPLSEAKKIETPKSTL